MRNYIRSCAAALIAAAFLSGAAFAAEAGEAAENTEQTAAAEETGASDTAETSDPDKKTEEKQPEKPADIALGCGSYKTLIELTDADYEAAAKAVGGEAAAFDVTPISVLSRESVISIDWDNSAKKSENLVWSRVEGYWFSRGDDGNLAVKKYVAEGGTTFYLPDGTSAGSYEGPFPLIWDIRKNSSVKYGDLWKDSFINKEFFDMVGLPAEEPDLIYIRVDYIDDPENIKLGENGLPERSDAAYADFFIPYKKGGIFDPDIYEGGKTSAPKPAAVKGDINGDGKLNVKDVTELLKKITGGTTDISMDFNGDEKVNVRDATDMLKAIVGG